MSEPLQPSPESGTLAEPQVRAMFDRIAGVYDRLNSVMTAGLHHRWRQRAVELADVGSGSRVLDVATGTGDLAFALAEAIGPSGQVVGADFSEQMLRIARNKAAAGSVGPASASVRFEQANALLLPHAA
ncbi:MAG: class I SAM-dependent methyltransferase, partial [Actinocrinis sp.]